MTTTALQRLMASFKSPEGVFTAGPDQWRKALGRMKVPEMMMSGGAPDDAIGQEIQEMEGAGVHLVCLDDDEYPIFLRRANTPPPLLYVKGSLKPDDERSVAIVGSRQYSQYGKEASRTFAEELARRGLTVISGFARGIDTTAHKAAIEAGGRTIAVLGNGLGRCYPPENKNLAEEVAESGAMISTFPMRETPEHYNFPERNYYLACMAPATIVVEAGDRSGALLTAGCALDEGRLVFAVPGDVFRTTSRGVNGLIRQGAILARSPEDVMEDLAAQWPEWNQAGPESGDAIDGKPIRDLAGLMGQLSNEEKEILDLVGRHSQSLEQLVGYFEERGQSFGQVTLWLLNLQMLKLIKQLPGNQYIRSQI